MKDYEIRRKYIFDKFKRDKINGNQIFENKCKRLITYFN